MKTKFTAYFTNLFNTFCIVTILYMALQYPEPWQTFAQNIFVFASWLGAFGYMAIAVKFDGDYQEGYYKVIQEYLDGKHLPKWMDVVQYFGFISVLAMYGWWFTAVAWVIITGVDMGIRDVAVRIENNNKDVKNEPIQINPRNN